MSTAPQHHDDAAGHRRQEKPPYQEDEDWSDSQDSKQPQQRRVSRRPHRVHLKQPVPYRRHTNEYFGEPSITQVRSEAIRYGVDPNPFAPQPEAYEPDPSPSYYPSRSTQPLPSYSSLYTYPASGGYPSAPAAIPRGNAFDPQSYGQDGGYYFSDVQPRSIPPRYAPAPSAYEYGGIASSYPQYSTLPPGQLVQTRPAQPRVSRLQRAQTDIDSRAAYVGTPDRSSQKKKSSKSGKEKSSSKDDETISLIMEQLKHLKKQVERGNSDLQSDLGRRRLRSSSTADISTTEDTRSLDIERQRSDHLMGIVNRLLEDREKQGYRDSYGRSSRNSLAALLGDNFALSDRDRDLINQRSTEEIDSKLDAILEILLMERRSDDGIPSQQLVPSAYDIRQIRRGPRSQPSVVSTERSQEIATPTFSQSLPLRRGIILPEGRKRQGVQYSIAQSSNQSRARHNLPKAMRPDEEADIIEDYEPEHRLTQRPLQPRRQTLSQEMGLTERRKSQAVVDQKTSEMPSVVRRTSDGDQQRVRSGRFAFVQTEDEQESDDQEPAPVRPSTGYHQRPPVPDPPTHSQRRRERSVRFGQA
ncbi:hypothetical protein FAVG1_08223 [Fusarium avenaceum]|nr:hypothetical protein FAVG1_08223 [Fusarium avenaceum]